MRAMVNTNGLKFLRCLAKWPNHSGISHKRAKSTDTENCPVPSLLSMPSIIPALRKKGVPLACAHARDHSRSVYVPAYYLLVYASSFAYFLFL